MKTTKYAAQVLGVSDRRVRALIKSNKLLAQKFGTQWMIKLKDIEKLVIARKKLNLVNS
jgi:excisionase family DNA binding protein